MATVATRKVREVSDDRPGRGERGARLRALWFPTLVVVGVLAPLAPSWFKSLTLAHFDTVRENAPVRWLVGHALRHGRLPLWDPHVATGMPLHAEAIHGALHPFSVLSAVVVPSDSLEFLLAMYVLAAGLGAACLARSMGASRSASTAAAFAYGLAGYTLSSLAYLNCIAGAGMLPWTVAGLRFVARDRSPGAFVAGTLGVTACALSGDLQALAAGVGLGLLLALEAGRWRGLVAGAAAVALGCLVGAAQLVPTWALVGLTDRGRDLPAWDLKQWALAPARLVELISPGFFVHPADGLSHPAFDSLGGPSGFSQPFARSIFVGGVVVALAFAGAAASGRGRVVAGAAVVLGWLATGHHLGARALLDVVPLVSTLRYTEKYVGPLTLCLALLAALGLDSITGAATPVEASANGDADDVASGALVRPPGEEGSGAWAGIGLGAVGLLAAVGIAFIVGAPALVGRAAPQHAAAIRNNLMGGLPYVFMALAAVAVTLVQKRRGARARAGTLLVAVVWAQSAAAAHFALFPGDPAARLHAHPPPIEATGQVPRLFVPTRFPARAPRTGWTAEEQDAFDLGATGSPNRNVAAKIDSMDVQTGFFPLRYLGVRTGFGPAWPRASRRYAVSHVIVPAGAEVGPAVERGQRVAVDPRTGAEIWSVPHREWASFPPSAESIPEPDRALERLKQMFVDGNRGAVIEVPWPVPTAPGRILSVSRRPEEVRIEAETGADAVLVINDAFWPGWRATLDGTEVPIWPADVLVRAVPWNAGRHTLVMRYDPREARLGLWASLAGLVLLASAGVGLWARKRRSLDHARGQGDVRT